jgi:hypothetical protein
MLFTEYDINDDVAQPGHIIMLSPGGDDDNEDGDDDWTDVDDEDFEDIAEDADDLHEMKINNDIYDPEDADHLPDDDD